MKRKNLALLIRQLVGSAVQTCLQFSDGIAFSPLIDKLRYPLQKYLNLFFFKESQIRFQINKTTWLRIKNMYIFHQMCKRVTCNHLYNTFQKLQKKSRIKVQYDCASAAFVWHNNSLFKTFELNLCTVSHLKTDLCIEGVLGVWQMLK